ncbi:MAG: alkaline phosphatase [Muribaculaceae bacterium]|nr:alkaline phosphatase [Muribaculaceae bacterium]
MRIRVLFSVFAALLALSMSATQPKYIFYFIGDGMGMGPATATEMYNRQILGNPDPITMMQFPVAGMALTYSESSPVTDSAAAGTALSTGSKTKNGMLGMNGDTVAVTSVARVLKDAGYGIGIATTVAPDDATPGAFYAHVPNRKMFYEIGVQAAKSGYEFLCGAGLRGETDKDGNPTDLLEIMKQNSVDVVRGKEEFEQSTSEKIFLLNYEGTDKNNVGYTIDSIEHTLSLPYITRACLSHLEKVSPDAFFMMIEGGNIDHALHANDGGAAIKETLNFNEAIAVAVDFYNAHPLETLIIVTADHDTGGMTVGCPFTGYNAHLDKIDYQKVSKEAFNDYCKGILKSRRVYTWDDMREYLAENFGFWHQLKLNEAQDASLKEKFEATFNLRNSEDQKTLYANFNAFATEVFKVFNDIAGIGFVATSHTGNPVPVYALGVGAYEFSNLNNNIDIPVKILQLVNGKK